MFTVTCCRCRKTCIGRVGVSKDAMIALFYYLIAMIFMVVLAYVLLFTKQYRNPLKTAPGEPLNWKIIFGTLEHHMKEGFRFFGFFQEQRRRYGTVRRVPLPMGEIGMDVSDREWVKYVLITNGANFQNGTFLGSGFFKQAVGENGLVVVNGEQHKKYKKILSPAYKLSTLKKSMFIVQMCGDRVVNLFSDYIRRNKITSGDFAGSGQIDVKYLFNKTTLDIAVLFLLGYDLQESCSWKTDTFGHYLWRVLEMQDNVVNLLSIFYMPSRLLRLIRKVSAYLPYGGDWRSAITNKMHTIIESVIEAQVNKLRPKQELSDDAAADGVADVTTANDPSDKQSFRPLLEYMLDGLNGFPPLSRQEIHDLVMTFIIGGHETASISLMFTLYELCKQPEYQTRLRNEVIKVFAEHKDKIDWDDITKKFPFLNACVKESLRMYPPIPWLPRIAAKADMIDGHYVPAKTMITVLTSELQRNPDVWPDPDTFTPERFLEPDDTIPWDAWLPFGDGFHKCIGYQFGLIEVSYLLAMVIKTFRFSLDPKIDYHEFVFVSLNTKPAMKLYVTPL